MSSSPYQSQGQNQFGLWIIDLTRILLSFCLLRLPFKSKSVVWYKWKCDTRSTICIMENNIKMKVNYPKHLLTTRCDTTWNTPLSQNSTNIPKVINTGIILTDVWLCRRTTISQGPPPPYPRLDHPRHSHHGCCNQLHGICKEVCRPVNSLRKNSSLCIFP